MDVMSRAGKPGDFRLPQTGSRGLHLFTFTGGPVSLPSSATQIRTGSCTWG